MFFIALTLCVDKPFFHTIMASMRKSTAPYIFLFIILTLARSTSFMFTKRLLEEMQTFNILAFRFIVAFLLLFIIFFKKMIHIDKRTLIGGIAIGVAFFATMAGETLALNTLDSSTTSFIEHTAIVLVPVIESILTKKLPKLLIIVCDVITLIGIGFLTLSSGGFRLEPGEIIALCTAIVYALGIIITNRYSQYGKTIELGVIQIGVMGILSLIATLIFETPKLPSGGNQWFAFGYLILICTGFAFTLQPVAQSRMSSEMAGLLCAVNPMGAAICGAIFLHETFAVSEVIGSILIMLGIVLCLAIPVVQSHRKSEVSS